MRPLLVKLHRWFGIGTALFLFMSGVTGAVIAWDHELDALLNPQFFRAATDAPPLTGLEIANRVERADPRLQVTYLPLVAERGEALQLWVRPRVDPANGEPYKLGFDQIAVDPATGAIQGQRQWGAFSVSRINLMPFIYKLHYTLHLPVKSGIDIGTWLMGVVGIVWLFDSLVAIVLSFPSRKSWRKSLQFRLRRGGYALTFDLHRSGGVWVWGVLLVIATTSISMNLSEPVVRPVVSAFSRLTPTPFQNPALRVANNSDVAMKREQIVVLAADAARRQGIAQPPGALFYFPSMKAYGVGFFAPGNDHGDGGLGNAWLYMNGVTGKLAGQNVPGTGSAGDIFMQAQYPLHSGRIFGLTGRILMSVMGVIVATLSATGLLIWIRKMAARRSVSTARQLGARAGRAG